MVTNTGNLTLHDVTVHDPTAGTVTCARTTLQPLEQLTCASVAHIITAAEAAQGKITNTVFFTTKGATVMDYAKTTVRVKSGKTAAWHAAAKFQAPQTTLCVLRGVG